MRRLVAFASILVTSGVLTSSALAAPATRFAVQPHPGATAGEPLTVDVTALDDSLTVDPTYDGVAAISYDDPAATVPATVTLTDGVGSFVMTPRTVRVASWDLTVEAAPLSGWARVDVDPGPPASIVLSAPATAVVPAFWDASVTVHDALGNIRNGTLVSISASDPAAEVPAPRVVTRDAPVIGLIWLHTLGPQTVTATVVADPSISDTHTVTVAAPSGGGPASGPSIAEVPPAPSITPPVALPVAVATPVQATLACSRIPTLTGLRFDAAKRVLRDDGCRAITVKRIGSLRRKGRPTRVRAQSPLPGTPLAQGATVTLRL